MKAPLRIQLVATALAIVLIAAGAVVALQALCANEPEPVYQGKRLSVWLDEYFRIKEVGAGRAEEGAGDGGQEQQD